MEFIENVEKREYEEFVRNSPKSHFMQSYYWGEVMQAKHYTPNYVGLKENGELVATALLLKKHMIKNLCYYYCPRGYILDYSNLELVDKFTNEIKKYAKKNHAVFVKIDPDIKRHELDIDGKIIENENNYKLIEKLKQLGYKHKGYNIDFVNEQPRFTFRLDLNDDFEKIYSRIHATTRKILNKKNQYNLETYVGTKKDIKDFYITMQETAKRENIACYPIKYYEQFYEILNKHNMSDLYIVKVKISNLKNLYKTKIEEINKSIDNLTEHPLASKSKTENKIKEYKNEQKKLEKDFNLINEIKEKEIILSSIITAKYNDKVWTIHGGNTTKLRFLNSNYWLYYTIIKDAYDEGYKKIDFFGTSGLANPPKESTIYGIHSFKKRLGGEYTEFIGEFDLVCNAPLYKLYNMIIPIRRKIAKSRMKKQ